MDKALAAGDKIAETLAQRISAVYSAALEQAIKNNRAFLKNVEMLDKKIAEMEEKGVENPKIEKWRKDELLHLLREQRLVESIADEMDRAGMAIAPEIKAQMVEVYKVNSDATFEALSQTINQHFTLLPKRQIEITLEDERPVFSKIAYQHLGQNVSIRRTLQNEMAQAALLGESQKKIIKRIARVTGMAEYQAQRVAQTERTRVQSQARADSLHEAAEMGIRVTKTWSARMRNTRDSHDALNGKTVMENEKFQTIWGNELAYPGDPNAPAREVINCHCVLIPDVLMPGERLKTGGESGIIEGTESEENEGEKAGKIAQEFRYTDGWGDEYSPIDRASFAAMPKATQESAASGIRKAKEIFGLESLPEKIGFGDVRGAYGLYSETNRTLTLSSTRCKDPDEAYSTMVHELTHYYDHASGHVAEKVYKQALKELGLRANSRAAVNETILAVGGRNHKEAKDVHEVLAYSVENAVKGSQSKLANKILEIVGRK